MRRFYCQCGQEIFFDNTHCGACGRQLGFDPLQQRLFSLEQNGSVVTEATDRTDRQMAFRFCAHREHELHCNWLVPAESHDEQCIACASTRMIPMLNRVDNWRRWRTLESAKRRLFYGLLRLKLPLQNAINQQQLIFDFLEDRRTNPDVELEHVLSGHAAGVITLNAAEADSSYREATREAMNEPYRTLLGHFRHEVGHFYWELLIKQSADYDLFCQTFGYQKQDYAESLADYYRQGPKADWQSHYISAYASAHPFEDWAETWAHYLLMWETLETALAFKLIPKKEQENQFETWMQEWLQLVVVMNALSRSTGNADAYPFVISETVQQKLKFIHQRLQSLQIK